MSRSFIDKRNLRRADGGDALPRRAGGAILTNGTAVVATKSTTYQAPHTAQHADGVVVVSVTVGAEGKILGPAKGSGCEDFVKRTFGRVDGVVRVEWTTGATRRETTRRELAAEATARTQAARGAR